MLPCHNLWDLEEQRGRGFLNLSYGGKGKSHKHQKQEDFWWGATKKTTQGGDHWTTLSGITYYFSFLWCKKMYALHKISSYSNLISKEVWINFSSWIYFFFFFYIIDFFINLQMTTESGFTFLNTAVIIFCLRCSLNILHQTSSFFPLQDAVSIFPKFGFRRHFTTPKIILTFFFRVILTLSRQT